MVLGDNFFSPKSFLADLIAAHIADHVDATVGVAEVSDVTRHGIIKPQGDHIIDLIEKSAPDKAPGCLGAIGVYVFEPSIFDAIRATPPGFKGELQFTGSIKGEVVAGKKVIYRTIDGIHLDVGTPHDLMRANEWYLNHNDGK